MKAKLLILNDEELFYAQEEYIKQAVTNYLQQLEENPNEVITLNISLADVAPSMEHYKYIDMEFAIEDVKTLHIEDVFGIAHIVVNISGIEYRFKYNNIIYDKLSAKFNK